FSDSTHSLPAELNNYDAVAKAIGDPSTKLEGVMRDISPEQRSFVEAVAKAVGAEPLAGGEMRTVTAAPDALRDWWRKLPNVEKIADLYPIEGRKRTESLRQALDDTTTDRFDLVLSRLPSVYANEVVDRMNATDVARWTKEFAADVKRLNTGLNQA